MPVPGPRSQFGPDDGYRNPGGEVPDRFNHWDRPGPIVSPGRSPGTMTLTLRGCILGPGQVRRMWRQLIDYVPAMPPFSWSANGPQPGQPTTLPFAPVGVTRALRYMTRSFYEGAGIDNTRYNPMHSKIARNTPYKAVTVGAGQVRNRPTVRNRITSFGSRVPPLNNPIVGAEGSQQ